MTTIRVETHIPVHIDVTFDLARDIDRHVRGMSSTSETAVAGRTTGLIGSGETVTWRARHFGITWMLTSKVTRFDRPASFTDSQTSGPFRSFEHEHRFVDLGESLTLMIDTWTHTAPFGPFGRVADALFLKRYMRGLLERRAAFLVQEALALNAAPTVGRSGPTTTGPTTGPGRS